ncbi:hypothetical protein EC957_004856 [Mortierella hygrophila]|uniref:Uncharacterized protein n=1 Tax=Mortierella hygrophila TaxID=979708 RepID=A0A9P6K0A9_9FUNG|nr:hypothetical protein EC957_004856 [Mortierella hygrophila]
MSGFRPMRNGRESSSSSSQSAAAAAAAAAAAEDEIPTIVLQEQMESMLVDMTAAEFRVRELREELDTFESHPIFSSMMLAWFLSFNLSEYNHNRIEDLKRDALKAWQPVLNSFMEGAASDNLTEIDVRLFESIIQDIISHADMIAGSNESPENLILNLKRIAHTELDHARRSLEQNRIAFQECQITLQARGVVPAAVLEMQRSMEEDTRREQEAKRAQEQRQREIVAERQNALVAERQRERQRQQEEEEERLRREQEREEMQKRDREREEKQRRDRERELERQRRERAEEEIRHKALAAARDKVARPASSNTPSSTHAAGHMVGRPKATSVSVPGYDPNFQKRMHAESPAVYALNISEEETVIGDSPVQAEHLAPYDDGEVPSTPLLRRNRPVKVPEPAVPGGAGMVSTSGVDSKVTPNNQYGYPNNNRTMPQHQHHADSSGQYVNHAANQAGYQGQGPEMQMQMQMPMPLPYEYNGHTNNQPQDMSYANKQTHPAQNVSDANPALYPPQIISEDELNNRMALEQLEQIKKRNDEILRDIQEQQRIHAITIQNLEMQGTLHDGGQDTLHAQGQFQPQTPYMSAQGYPPPPQHVQQHHHGHQQGYQGYQGDFVADQSGVTYNNGGAMNGQGQEAGHQGDMYNNYQHYQGYNHGNMNPNNSNWNAQQQQQQQQQQHSGYIQQLQQQQQQYPASLTPAQLQQLQQQQQYQQQLQMEPEGSLKNGYTGDHRLRRVQSVSYSTSPFGHEYDFGPVEAKVGAGVVRMQQPVQQPVQQPEPAKEQSPPTTQVHEHENDASSANVLPQIRAKPANLANRRAPHVILSEAEQEAAAKALKEMQEEEEAEEGVAATEVSEETVVEREIPLPVKDKVLVAIRQSSRPQPTEVATYEVGHAEEAQEVENQGQQRGSSQEEKQRRGVDEEDDEEETLHRRVRRMHVSPKPVMYTPKPTPQPAPPTSQERKERLVTPTQSQVETPVVAPRRSPRPSPRPAPRPVGGMVRSSQEPLSVGVSGHRAGNSESSEGEKMTPMTPTEPSVDTKRMSLHRSPSSPPVVPKKPLALRSPRRNDSQDDNVVA